MAAKLGLGVFLILRIHFSQIRMGLFKANRKRTRINKIERPIIHGRFDRLKDFPVSFAAKMIFFFTKSPIKTPKASRRIELWGRARVNLFQIGQHQKYGNFGHCIFILGDPGWGGCSSQSQKMTFQVVLLDLIVLSTFSRVRSRLRNRE